MALSRRALVQQITTSGAMGRALVRLRTAGRGWPPSWRRANHESRVVHRRSTHSVRFGTGAGPAPRSTTQPAYHAASSCHFGRRQDQPIHHLGTGAGALVVFKRASSDRIKEMLTISNFLTSPSGRRNMRY